MDKLTKDEVILQLANLASGIERTQNDTHKAKALREAIRLIDEAEKQQREIQSLKNDAPNQYRQFYAMVAHVERINAVLPLLLNVRGIENFDEVNETDVIRKLSNLMGQSPKTSLAEHDTEVKASALEEAVELFTHKLDGPDELNQVAINIIKKGSGFIYPAGLLDHAKISATVRMVSDVYNIECSVG